MSRRRGALRGPGLSLGLRGVVSLKGQGGLGLSPPPEEGAAREPGAG